MRECPVRKKPPDFLKRSNCAQPRATSSVQPGHRDWIAGPGNTHGIRKGNKHWRAGLTPAQRGGGAILYTHTAPSLLLTEALLVSNRRLICFTFMYKFLSRVIAKAIATYIRLMCVSVCVWVSVCCQYRVFFAYRQWTDGCIFMIFTHMIDIDDIVKLSKGQGHGVKGQIHGCV